MLQSNEEQCLKVEDKLKWYYSKEAALMDAVRILARKKLGSDTYNCQEQKGQ